MTGFPQNEVEDLINFGCRDLPDIPVDITVGNAIRRWNIDGAIKAFYGDASYTQYDSTVHPPCSTGTIRLFFDPNAKLPREQKYINRKTAPIYTLKNWQEMVMCLAAHEARHITQKHTKGKYSEIDAEKYVVEKLAEYRSIIQNNRGFVQYTVPEPLYKSYVY